MHYTLRAQNNLNGAYILKDIHVIDTLEALRAMSDPLRLRILEALESEPLSATQIARGLSQRPNKLHYHLQELEKNGLIEMVEARQKGNLIEKYYRPVARVFRVSNSLFESGNGPEALAALYQQVASNFDITLAGLKAAIQAGTFTEKEAAASLRVLLRWPLNPERAEAFKQRLNELISEFAPTGINESNTQTATLTLLLYSAAPESKPGIPVAETPEENSHPTLESL